jgi:hypothetical protein
MTGPSGVGHVGAPVDGPPSIYVELDLSDVDRLRAVAEEGSMTDRDLDELEARLLAADAPGRLASDPSAAAALALQIARAGRPSSRRALETAHTHLVAAREATAARVLELALDLVERVPSSRVERAESGYRHHVPERPTLFVEDPLAAYWHRRDRWGPPLRPDPSTPATFLAGPRQLERGARVIAEGGTALVTFAPPWWGRPERPLFLCRAGLARDVRLALDVRWSEVLSIGTLTRGARVHAAFEVAGHPRVVLPAAPSVPTDELVALLERLVEAARR